MKETRLTESADTSLDSASLRQQVNDGKEPDAWYDTQYCCCHCATVIIMWLNCKISGNNSFVLHPSFQDNLLELVSA